MAFIGARISISLLIEIDSTGKMIVISGAIFCHVTRRRQLFQEIDDITDGNQK